MTDRWFVRGRFEHSPLFGIMSSNAKWKRFMASVDVGTGAGVAQSPGRAPEGNPEVAGSSPVPGSVPTLLEGGSQ